MVSEGLALRGAKIWRPTLVDFTLGGDIFLRGNEALGSDETASIY